MIRRLNSQKHLGLTLDSKLTFNQHLKEKISKANIGILMIRKLYRYLPRSTLLTVYKSFIRPHLDYCDMIYPKPCNDDISMQNSSQGNICQPNKLFTDKIESVQYNAALAITGHILGTSKEKLYNELGLTSLYNRRSFHRLLYFYKIKNNLLPGYLKNEIPVDSWIITSTNKYKYSFFQQSVNSWSSLSNLIKASPSTAIFKRRYIDFYQITVNPIYGILNHVGLSLLTRLR